ncbi:DUF805 domain-containing protein [Roseibium aggregatum]|uniref:DUF805 domain-containing protein n=1 Tax=Roseibium aggregatum TaxID=187304 RepID=A0A939E9V4_9HYPH|nr:DUF805 domain-containing protein [Roseibium aggregatum]MBN9669003.1 DUF805 domain-containing protein [Roseibium aggregatum]
MQRKQFGKRGETSASSGWGHPQAAVASYPAAMPVSSGAAVSGSESSVFGSLAGAIFSAFDFTGRTGLLGYWVQGLAYLLFMAVMGVAFVVWCGTLGLENLQSPEEFEQAMDQPAFYAFALVYVIGSVYRWALEARRMHDRGVSAFWIFAWFIPIAGAFIFLWQWFKNCFVPGDVGRNQFDQI